MRKPKIVAARVHVRETFDPRETIAAIERVTAILPLFKELSHVVEVRDKGASLGRAWEPIAAFNAVSVAHAYADSCRFEHSSFEYRVRCI